MYTRMVLGQPTWDAFECVLAFETRYFSLFFRKASQPGTIISLAVSLLLSHSNIKVISRIVEFISLTLPLISQYLIYFNLILVTTFLTCISILYANRRQKDIAHSQKKDIRYVWTQGLSIHHAHRATE